MSDTNDNQEIINDIKKKAEIPIKGTPADLIAKFTRKQTEAGLPSGENANDPMLGRIQEELAEETIVDDNEGQTKPLIQPEKKKPGFVQKQIEENRRLKEELEKFKNDEIPKYTSKIAELEALVKGSQTTAEANHYQEQLNKANEQKAELESQLSKEIQDLRSKLDFYDLTSNKDFQEQYVKPIQTNYNEAKKLIGADQQLTTLFSKAITANTAQFQLANEEDRQLAIRERDDALEEIVNALPLVKQSRFLNYIDQYMQSTERHAQALYEFENTKQEITRTAKQKELQARTQFINTWRDSYKAQQEAVEKDIQISDEIESYMKEKGIKFDTSKDDAIALAATQQSDEPATVDDMNRLINQGRVYKKLQALVKAQQEMIREKDEYISKLKGSSSVTSTSATTDTPAKKLTLPEGLAAKLSRFTPAGRKLAVA
jgi:hypothetical protein